MPLGDGIGPDGRGPLTGRGLGRCFLQGRGKGSILSGKGRVSSIGLALAGIIVRDAFNPDGVTRRLVNGVCRLVSGMISRRERLSSYRDQKSIKQHTHIEIKKQDKTQDTL